MKTCILAIQRYENINDIIEWIDYHIKLGISHIFLLDNNDENDMLELEHDNLTILRANDIKVISGDSTWQCIGYNRGLDYIKSLNEYDWVAVIDIDEFIRLFHYDNINEFIERECVRYNKDNIELIWRLYSDNNLIYHKKEYDGNIQSTFKKSLPIINTMFANNYNKFYSMRAFVKFIGKIKPELEYSVSPHYPSKDLYDKQIYKWNVCNPNIAVIDHYKYKTLEDFISYKCKYRSYIKSVHGSTWKYARTYFEDNDITLDKIFHFVMFEYKYNLNMIEWDIKYLHELLNSQTDKTRWKFDIWFGQDVENNILNKCLDSQNKYCTDFYTFTFNENNLNLDICDYTRFMYDHKLYGICADFYKFLFLYYFGGVYMDRDVQLFKDLTPYYDNNDYMLFDATFHNLGAWFTNDSMFCSGFIASKPFNKLFKYFIDYCKSFTYDELEQMYNSKSKKDFMDNFYDVKIIYYQIIKKYNYQVKVLNDINEETKTEDNVIYVYNNNLFEFNKYLKTPDNDLLLLHHNLKTHENLFLK